MSEKCTKEFGLQSKFLPRNIAPLPVFFIKTPVFTPSSKNTNRMKEVRKVELDNFYGYSSIKIKGLALNLNNDFKILATLLKIRDEIDDNSVRIPILDFAEIMGANRRSVSASTKKAIDESLDRLMSQTISFNVSNKNGNIRNITKANLINNAEINFEEGFINIVFNDKIIDIYKKDKYVQYVNMQTFSKIKGEVAKALWLFYEANSKFLVFKKESIEKRLQLKQKISKEINRQINNAHKELIKAGYLTECTFDKVNNSYKIKRHKNKQKT